MPALTSNSKRASAALGDIRREFDRRRKLAAVATGRVEKKSSSALSPVPNVPAGAAPAPIPRKPAAAAMIKRPSVPTPAPRAPEIAYMDLGEAPGRCTAPKGRPTQFGMKVSGVANGGIIQKSPAPLPHEPAGAPIKRPSVPTPRKLAEAATKKFYVPPISPATLPPSAAFKTIKKGSTVLVRTRVGALPTGMGLVLWLSAVVVTDAAEDGCFEVMYNGDFPRDDPFRTVRMARDQVKSMPSQK